MFENYTDTIFPADTIIGPPNDRQGQAKQSLALPAGTIVFSADNHVELTEDIWHQQFPAALKEKAPRIWQGDNGVTHFGMDGKSWLPSSFVGVLGHFSKLGGTSTKHMDERMKHLDAEGIDKELVFPQSVLALLNYPDLEVREYCFRIYNEYLAALQERYEGRFYGVGLINWWDAEGARRTLAELKYLGLRTFMLPLKAGTHADGTPVDYASTRMIPVWDAIAKSELPVSHHIGEVISGDAEFNRSHVGFMHSVATFRETFARYIFGGILDRHPSVKVGWFEGGINWVPSALQDAEFLAATYKHIENLKLKHDPEYYWRNHMCASFIVDPLGLEMVDRIGVENVMWSCDYPHNESSYGFSKNSINSVVKAVGPEKARAIVGGNVARFLGL
jgi:predicted TIM-barrel fold metal-dependent hydrolase